MYNLDLSLINIGIYLFAYNAKMNYQKFENLQLLSVNNYNYYLIIYINI